MNSSATIGELQRAGKPAPKANKSCVSCRARKIKCDAAVIGLPCSGCTIRQSADECVLPVRKGRTRRVVPSALPTLSQGAGIPATSNTNQSNQSNQPKQLSTSSLLGCQSPLQTEPDLLYLHILHDAVKETTESSRHHATADIPYRSRPEESLTPWNRRWAELPQLDDIDTEYLVKKGVFDLPPAQHVDVLIKTYFDHVYPFAPVINRVDFIRGYQSGDCSLFLLHVILTPASLHAPVEVLSACGFDSRSAAQESFFSKAKLLHDFAAEEDPVVMLQGSIILCMVILDRPTDRDFGYWFHNAIRLATKLDLRNTCVREDKPRKALKLYRRIWWALYLLDIFHVIVNTRRSRLLEDSSTIKPRTEDDWEAEDLPGTSSNLLSAVTPQQKALPVAYCELAQIFGQCLSIVKDKLQQDPRQMMRPLDAWRKSLAVKMHLSRHEDWDEWAQQRLQTAILELDMIAKRVLASGTLQNFPVSFVTTISALLALHIEAALDPAETDLSRSMAQISISQAMLVLSQGKEIPAVKRALPVFEEIIAKKHLYLVSPNISGQQPMQSQSQDNGMSDAYASPHTQDGITSSQSELFGNNPSFDADFQGFGVLDEWQIGQLDFSG